MDKKPLYLAIARTVDSYQRCLDRGDDERASRWLDYLVTLTAALPRGSGFDAGCTIVPDNDPSRGFVILAPFHAMDGNGYYDGWEEYRVRVRPCLAFGFRLVFTRGRDRNGLKDYVAEVLHAALSEPAPPRVDG